MKKISLALAAFVTTSSIAFAQSAPNQGVLSIQQEGDVVYMDIATPVTGTLEVISGDDVYQVNIPAGNRRVGIPASELVPFFSDRHDDVFVVRDANGNPVGVGQRLPTTRDGRRMKDHSPYLTSVAITDQNRTQIETMRDQMSTQPQ